METSTAIYYTIEPEVAGGLGANTLRDSSVHPPVIHRLHYVFEGWLGDDIVESFPVYLVSERLKGMIEKAQLTGIGFADAKIGLSPTFRTLQPHVQLPRFHWLRVTGQMGKDDFAINSDHLLTLSESAFAVLKQTNINHCQVEQTESYTN